MSKEHRNDCPIAISQRGDWAASISPECNCPPEPQEVSKLDVFMENVDKMASDLNDVAQPSEGWEVEFDKQFAYLYDYSVKDRDVAHDFDYERLKAFIAQVEAAAFDRGRKMKGSSWREGYETGRRETEAEWKAEAEHYQQKFLEGFDHPKDCKMCLAAIKENH